MKTCTKCSIEKVDTKFDYQRNVCQDCRNAKRRQRIMPRYEVAVTEKCCRKCKTFKPAGIFNRNSRVSDGLSIYCIDCTAEKSRKDYLKNPERLKKNAKARYEKLKGTEAINGPARERQRLRSKTNPKYKLSRLLRNRLYYALQKKSWKKNTKFSEYIGCDLQQLKSHIEKQFTLGMSWENQGEWHLDHIIPLESAKNEIELYELCHYTNIQPLWGFDNLSKGCTV